MWLRGRLLALGELQNRLLMLVFGGKPDMVISRRPVRPHCVLGTQFEFSRLHHAVLVVPKVSDPLPKAPNLRALAG
jgi:hypothetical protein